MLSDTWSSYISIRIVILIFQWLSPSCLAYTAWTVSKAWPEIPTITGFRIWCAAESAFYVFFLWYRVHLQREAVHPPLRSKRERKALFAKVRREVHDPDKFMSGWFRGAKPEDIGREDLRLFLNWTFWDGRADMAPGGADEKELDYYMNKVETMMRKPFKPGYGTAKGLRLTLDPIQMECRTLFWYSLVCANAYRMSTMYGANMNIADGARRHHLPLPTTLPWLPILQDYLHQLKGLAASASYVDGARSIIGGQYFLLDTSTYLSQAAACLASSWYRRWAHSARRLPS
jgi:hypothetical protein